MRLATELCCHILEDLVSIMEGSKTEDSPDPAKPGLIFIKIKVWITLIISANPLKLSDKIRDGASFQR